jgi:hypothetical protein
VTGRQITALIVLWLAAAAVAAVRQGLSVVTLALIVLVLAGLAVLALTIAVFWANPRPRLS